MNAKEIRELFKSHGLDLSRDDVWEVQGNLVIRHKALERLAASLRIVWQEPKILRAEREEAVVLVSGHCGKGLEWSIGEALLAGEHANYRATSKTGKKMPAYVWAMAEKRGKDRVILKLAGLHGAYSEDEADDFKQEPHPEPKPEPKEEAADDQAEMDAKQIYMSQSLSHIGEFKSASALLAWAKEARQTVWPEYGIDPHDPDGQKFVKAYKDRIAELEKQPEEVA